MKKIYLIPSITVVNVQTARMIATSDPRYGGETEETEGNLSREGTDFSRRHHDVWEEEEEEEKDF